MQKKEIRNITIICHGCTISLQEYWIKNGNTHIYICEHGIDNLQIIGSANTLELAYRRMKENAKKYFTDLYDNDELDQYIIDNECGTIITKEDMELAEKYIEECRNYKPENILPNQK